jgi:cytidylate kinase
LTYRAVAKAMLDAGQPLDDEAAAVEAARTFDISDMRRDVLAAHEIGEAASRVAVMPGVRRVWWNASANSPKRARVPCSTAATSVPSYARTHR